YFALWIFALPFMMIASIVIGGFFFMLLWKDNNKVRQIEKWRKRNLGDRQTPPPGTDERKKWANRLPPYNK
ncbi:MAG: hypothetical protein P8O69_10645, partial [Amylibacter sp.]|nr:hypothetical protein [Amylibacter sp.]